MRHQNNWPKPRSTVLAVHTCFQM